MAITKRREVVIIDKEEVNMYFVRYSNRLKYGRYSPAQFDKRDTTLEEVMIWVKSQPNLILKGVEVE